MHGSIEALLVLALLAGPAVSTAADQDVEVLTLPQALNLALENSASVLVAELQIERAENELLASRTRRLPRLAFEAQGTRLLAPIRITFPGGSLGRYLATGPIPASDTVIESGEAPVGHVSASLAQPLTQLYRVGLGVKASQLSRDADRQTLRAERAAVAHEVRRLYYSALQARSAVEAAREQVETLREMDREMVLHVATETALRQDGMEVKARLAAADYRRISLGNALATYKEQLNVVLGRDPAVPFELAAVSGADLEPVALETARARALAHRPELERARLQVELADTDRRLKKAESIPELSLALSYDSFFNVELLPRNVAQVGIQLKWEPFDWGRRSKELAAKTLAVEQARRSARQEKSRVLAEVDRAFRLLEEARALVTARRLGHESAEERVRVALLRRREQATLLRDALQAQADMAEARAQYDEAQLSLWQARADLEKAMGEDR